MQLVILNLSFDYTSHTKRAPLPAHSTEFTLSAAEWAQDRLYAGTGYEMGGQAAGSLSFYYTQDRFGTGQAGQVWCALHEKRNIEYRTRNSEL